MSDEALIRKLVADGDGNVLCYNSSKGHLKLLTYQRYNTLQELVKTSEYANFFN